MATWKFIQNPYNWLVVWTMLLIGWFVFHIVRKSIPQT